jgi:hypothetical protein
LSFSEKIKFFKVVNFLELGEFSCLIQVYTTWFSKFSRWAQSNFYVNSSSFFCFFLAWVKNRSLWLFLAQKDELSSSILPFIPFPFEFLSFLVL